MTHHEVRPDPAWQEALATRSNVASTALPASGATRPPRGVERRTFLRGAFWLGVAASIGGAAGTLLDYLYPRGVRRAGGPVPAGYIEDYRPGGDPVANEAGNFYLVNLDGADATERGGGGASGLLALWRKCPHLGCSVPWKGTFSFEGEQGWFRCPCHQSTYTLAGVRVFGPAPRSMDTMALEVAEDGSITVHTDQIFRGGTDNPSRAVPTDRPRAEQSAPAIEDSR